MRGNVVDDDVVVNVVQEVARHQEAQTTAIIIGQVVLDQVGKDIDRAGTGCERIWIGR